MSKGESLLDTAWTIEAMGVDALVVRSELSGAAELIDAHTECAVLNGGDGTHEHPTQALTDALNIGRSQGRDEGWDFKGLRVVIVGDVVSSRVARSNVGLLTALGAEVVLVGPSTMAPDSMGAALGCSVSRDLDSALSEGDGADVVMMLRIQFERGGGALLGSVREYHAMYGLSGARAEALKDGAVVLHPGPMNRGVEIAGAVADGPRSLVLDQVRGGVSVRRAALAHALG